MNYFFVSTSSRKFNLCKSFEKLFKEFENNLRKVRGIGYFSYKGINWYLSEALIGEHLALRPTKKDGFWMVCYGSFAVGLLDEHCKFDNLDMCKPSIRSSN